MFDQILAYCCLMWAFDLVSVTFNIQQLWRGTHESSPYWFLLGNQEWNRIRHELIVCNRVATTLSFPALKKCPLNFVKESNFLIGSFDHRVAVHYGGSGKVHLKEVNRYKMRHLICNNIKLIFYNLLYWLNQEGERKWQVFSI